MLTPINPEWIAPFPSVRGDAGLCRDEDGSLWLCTLTSEADGWQKVQPATDPIIEAFRWCQRLAGKEPQPWPEQCG